MTEPTKKSHFEEFLDEQVKPAKPTPKQFEWAIARFSSRAGPPKDQP